MGKKTNKKQKDKSFSLTLAQIRIKAALINAILIVLALGVEGRQIDYIIAGVYLVLNLFFLLIPTLRIFATNSLRFIMFGIDLLITGYMIAVTGGSASELYPFLFIPVILAVLRCKYPIIIVWCSMMSGILIGAAIYSKTFYVMPLMVKVSYLFLAGITGGYLGRHTFTIKEEISKTLARWNIDLQRLNSFSQEVTGSSDLEEIFKQIIKTVRQTNSLQMVAIMMFTDEMLKIYDSMGWEDNWINDYNKHPLSKHSLTLAPIIVFKEPLIITSIQKHPELMKIFDGIPVESLFAFPLVITGEVVGAMVVTTEKAQTLSDQEIQILTSIANQASIAIQNIVSLSQEKQKADTDGLTGLYNRRYFNEQMEWLSNRAIQQEQPLSLILIDLDNFKSYNDTFGHPAGDQLLKNLALTITDVVREQDVFARYGGEEFAIILKDTNYRLASHIAERVRQAVQEIPTSKLKRSVTISVGVGTLPDHAKNKVSLLEFVDKSLYHAKKTGKNKVCCGY